MSIQCENVIGNVARPSAAYRETAGGFRVPQTGEREVGLALKRARGAAPPPRLSDAIAGLARIGHDQRWLTDQDLAHIAQATGSPIQYMRGSLERLNAWLRSLPDWLSDARDTGTGHGCFVQGVHWARGLVTAVVLAGDAVTLGPWVLAHTALAGAHAVVKPSNADPLSTARFAAAMITQGLPCASLLHFDRASDADTRMLKYLVAQAEQSVVFGEDRTVQVLYDTPPTPPHKAIPHWTGRSGALVLRDADLELAARAIVHGATEDRGNRCISTKKAFVPRELASRFEQLVCASAEALRRGDPTDAATEVGRSNLAARAAAEAAAFEGDVVYSRDFFATRCSRGARALRDEIPYPILGITYYDHLEEAVASANASVAGTPSRRALAMAVFTPDRDAFVRTSGHLAAFKVLHNAPTTQMDYRTRHQGIFLHREMMREIEVCVMTDHGR